MLILTVDSWKYLEYLKLNLDLKHKIELNLLNVSLSWQIWMLIFFWSVYYKVQFVTYEKTAENGNICIKPGIH